MSVSSIKGYRSTLAHVFKEKGLDLSSSAELSNLIRSFDLELPPHDHSVPKWDISVVLKYLLKPPFEPLASASRESITLKTVFLVALATAKRVSELQAISAAVTHSDRWKSMTLTFARDFVAKTQRPSDPSTALQPVTLPALSVVGPNDLDAQLCPVRALRTYLDVTKKFRPECKRLFVSLFPNAKKNVGKNTLSRWIRRVIRQAYLDSSPDELKELKVSAHEVRAISTSLAFLHNSSLQDVMLAASWRGHSTFSTFYLRDVTHHYGELSALGPVVAAQSILNPGHSSH